MLLDKENILSDAQAVTVTAASTNYIDTQNTVNRIGKPLELFAKIPTAFTAGGAATMVIAIREDATDAMAGSPAVVVQTAPIAVADLVAGAKIAMPQLPKKTLRYLDAYFTIATGPMLTGAIDIGMVVDEQTNGYDAIKEQNDLL